MLKISNLKNKENLISFDYYCENKDNEKGSVVFDGSTNKIVEGKLAPMEEKAGFEIYQSIAVRYAKIMLENNENEKVICWY